ncbi:MAG TPA: hypothetical protein VEF04_13015 [Blastocatellia bacterium]|nr:hypothetical protein [Blastocatellia bacterium]
MPIRKELRQFYGDEWRALSNYVRFERAGGRYEVCGAIHGWPHPVSGHLVRLAAHHVRPTYGRERESDLLSVCEICHLKLDRPTHRMSRQYRKDSLRPLFMLL